MEEEPKKKDELEDSEDVDFEQEDSESEDIEESEDKTEEENDDEEESSDEDDDKNIWDDDKEDKKPMKMKSATLWKIISAVLLILLLISMFTTWLDFGNNTPTGASVSDSSSDSTVATADSGSSAKFTATIVNDERCTECDTTNLETQLKQLFPSIEIKEVDYSSAEGKQLYDNLDLGVLPAVLFSQAAKKDSNYAQVEQWIDAKGDYLSLRIGASFDPNAEICDNGIDDNGDSAIDCADTTCKSEWKCMEKKDKPTVELFVMSHCPYGTQIEKGMLPVAELLGDKIDFDIKFCDYAMHGEKELNEQLIQYCIQNRQNDKYLDYLKCFLEAGNSETCLTQVGIDQDVLDKCVAATDKEYKVTEGFNDKTTYKGSFPTFSVFQSDVDKYGVQGSPTLVINGVTASTGRDSVSLLNAVCTGFKDKPAECDETLSSANPTPGFGFDTTTAAAADATCE